MSNFKAKLIRNRNRLQATYYSSINDVPDSYLFIIKLIISILNSILEFLDDKENDSNEI